MTIQLKFATLIIGLSYLEIQQAHAQLLKVDINTVNQSGSANTAPGYVAWNTIPATNQKSLGFFTNAAGGAISCTVSQTVPAFGTANTVLKANWGNKNGQNKYQLSFDGVWTHNTTAGIECPYTNGGAFCLIISNLPAGAHTIATYHNDVWGNPAGGTAAWHGSNVFLSGCVVSVDGATVLTNTPSSYATNDAQCGFAYFTVNAVAGLPVVISFDPDHTSTNNLDFVVLNGFVIDGLSPGTQATGPIPVDGDEHVFAHNDDALPGSAGTGYTTLQWTPSQFAVTNDVYFSTSSNAVNTAAHASPEFKGSFTTNFWNTATNLNSALSYYWRVDQVDSTNGVFKGDVWRFRPRHLAFPGAEGWGRFTIGGRGGTVIEVTNTNDAGPGSFRAAVEANIPRTVVFNVSGLITLESKLQLHNPYITVAGQTAPGKGICIRKYNFGMLGAKDAIVRFVRVRPGNIAATTLDGMGMASSDHCIIDHCSVGWSIDEAFSSRAAGNITLQRTLISEALNQAGHTNYPAGTQHGYAASIGGQIGSFHHNLLAHCAGRNWSLAGGLDSSSHHTGWLDIRNNVVYNWKNRTTDGGAAKVNFVSNYYKPGAATTYFKYLNPERDNVPAFGPQDYYVTNNVMIGYCKTNSPLTCGVTQPEPYTNFIYATPFFENYVTTQFSPHAAYKHVLSDVGCNQPVLDDHDVRVIQETRSNTYTYVGSQTGLPGLPDSQDDVGGWESYPQVTRPADWDTDHDGMPDWWETVCGVGDSNADPDGDGYTALEDYLNWLAAPHTTCAQGSFVDIDLSQFTAGFTNVPVHTVFGATNGTVAVTNTIARFTPATNGLAAFSFAVLDAEGNSLTNTIGIRVLPADTLPLTPFQQWQVTYFNSTNNPSADANADPDGDGQSNFAEFLSGTVPTNALSALRIISAARQSNDVIVTWMTVGSRTNAVQATQGDEAGSYNTNFADITGPINISGSGEVITNYIDTGGLTNSPSRYYRIRLVP